MLEKVLNSILLLLLVLRSEEEQTARLCSFQVVTPRTLHARRLCVLLIKVEFQVKKIETGYPHVLTTPNTIKLIPTSWEGCTGLDHTSLATRS